MKIAALADIHGNLRAAERVVEHIQGWGPDEVVVVGDTINRGPRSIECLDLVTELARTDGWHIVRGNHEEYVLDCETADYAVGSPKWSVFRGAHRVFDQLGARRLELVKNLPPAGRLEGPDGREIVFTHGSLLGSSEGIFPWTRSGDLHRMVDTSAALFLCAHTHVPLRIEHGDTLIVNVGSVGLPFDGDPRAAYFQLVHDGESWQSREVRLQYDRDAAEKDFQESGYLQEGGALSRLVLEELQTAESVLFSWMQRYFGDVLDKTITVEDAVEAYLRRDDE